MIAAALALSAAVVLAVATTFTKRIVITLPHRQLIGPLLLINAALVAPAAIVAHWRLSGSILLLHGASAVVQLIGSFCVFELFTAGSAAAVAVAQALAPMPALVFSLALLSSTVSGLQAAGAIIVMLGVLAALGALFGTFSRARAVTLAAAAATTAGLLVVLTKLLADRGVGIGEIYVVRTAIAGIAATVLVPPRAIPRRALPALGLRSALQSGYFVLLIAAVERGNPTTVQTLAATTPLLLVGTDAVVHRRPSGRLTAAALAVVVGVVLSVS